MRSILPLSAKDLKAAVNELNLSQQQQKWVINSLKIVLKLVLKQKKLHKLVPYPDIQNRWYVRQVVTGGYWQIQKRQRRRVTTTFPTRDRGTPKQQYADYLVKKLGEIYVRATGKKPTRGATGGSFSQFERFAIPFLVSLTIRDCRQKIRDYIKWRKTQGL
jgi:hypothetical protein